MEKLKKKKIDSFLDTYMIVVIIVMIGLVLTFTTKAFMTQDNLLNVLRQVSINGILAMGMTCVALTGGIDLSVGSVLALCGIITAGLLRDYSLPIVLIILIALAIGTLCGVISGFFVAYRDCPPFCTTLAMMTIARGLTYVYSDGRPISTLPDSFLVLGKGSVLGIPNDSRAAAPRFRRKPQCKRFAETGPGKKGKTGAETDAGCALCPQFIENSTV